MKCFFSSLKLCIWSSVRVNSWLADFLRPLFSGVAMDSKYLTNMGIYLKS